MKTSYAVVILVILIGVVAYAFVHTKNTAQVVQSTLSASYICNEGKTISALYTQGPDQPAATPGQPPAPTGTVALTLSDGRTMTLNHTVSADGGRYANADESFVFWDKGNGALVLENNQEKSYTGCIVLAPQTAGLSAAYANGTDGFSIRLPALAASTTNSSAGYKPDESYQYQALGPGKAIAGVKFTIPGSLAAGTNLSTDSYVSVEQIPNSTECTASLFLDQGSRAATLVEGDTTYSVASSSDAGAGNRYEETVYALPGTNPCVAVRYFIHYGAIENYPAGAVTQFDKNALLAHFDAIRRTLVIVQ